MFSINEQIPCTDDLKILARNARMHPIDLNSIENSEPAIDVRNCGISGENYYHREDNPPYMHCAPASISELYLRKGVVSRLHQINEKLKRMGYEVFLHDAYRPPALQNYFHDFWIPLYFRKLHPDWNEEQIRVETGKYWAKGVASLDDVDPLSPPPHATGAVLDLTIRKLSDKSILNMGTPFDDVSNSSAIDYYEELENIKMLTQVEREMQQNRRLLFWTMHDGGFVNYPREWWHYGRGDQLSAVLSGKSFAIYSVLKFEKTV